MSKPCEKCQHQTQGILHGYLWQECKKNWSDKVSGPFIGVVKNTCNNYIEKKA